MPQSPLRTSSTTTQVTPRMFSPSIETIASVRRSTICFFCSDVNTSSISLTLTSGMRSSLVWFLGVVAGGATYPTMRIELHDLDRLTIFDRAIVQRDRADAPESGD